MFGNERPGCLSVIALSLGFAASSVLTYLLVTQHSPAVFIALLWIVLALAVWRPGIGGPLMVVLGMIGTLSSVLFPGAIEEGYTSLAYITFVMPPSLLLILSGGLFYLEK
ncbi:MAG: hypothetical protein KAI14_04995 [Dehalococcoidales bacterium]|nr:hypothetical protein [Dehalococcoidales bacterium]